MAVNQTMISLINFKFIMLDSFETGSYFVALASLEFNVQTKLVLDLDFPASAP